MDGFLEQEVVDNEPPSCLSFLTKVVVFCTPVLSPWLGSNSLDKDNPLGLFTKMMRDLVMNFLVVIVPE